MKNLCVILACIFVLFGYSQENVKLNGKVLNVKLNVPLENVFIVNLSTFYGGVTDEYGNFSLNVTKGDTVLISKLGFQKEKIVVTDDIMKKDLNFFYIVPKNYSLNEVIIKPHNLTGFLDIDLKLVEQRVSPSIVKLKGMKSKDELPSGSIGLGLGDPVGFLYSKFSKKSKQINKITSLEKSDSNLASLMKHRNDREIVTELLDIKKDEIEQILIKCGYPPEFVIKGNDLEIINALQDCYKNYNK